jgi:hypothetical protein
VTGVGVKELELASVVVLVLDKVGETTEEETLVDELTDSDEVELGDEIVFEPGVTLLLLVVVGLGLGGGMSGVFVIPVTAEVMSSTPLGRTRSKAWAPIEAA